MYRNQRNVYQSRRRSSAIPNISLPEVKGNFNWVNANRILCIDQSLNDSGAALYIDGKYVPVHNSSGKSIGWALTLPVRWQRQEKILAYGAWVRELISEASPDVVIAESHPFARGKQDASTISMETLIGVRWVTMFVAAQSQVPYTEFSTNHVKYILCGGFSVSKGAIQTMLRAIIEEIPVYESKSGIVNGNVCDAIAMCEVISRMQKQEKILSEYAEQIGKGRTQTHSRNK